MQPKLSGDQLSCNEPLPLTAVHDAHPQKLIDDLTKILQLERAIPALHGLTSLLLTYLRRNVCELETSSEFHNFVSATAGDYCNDVKTVTVSQQLSDVVDEHLTSEHASATVYKAVVNCLRVESEPNENSLTETITPTGSSRGQQNDSSIPQVCLFGLKNAISKNTQLNLDLVM